MKKSNINFDSLREATKALVKFRNELDWNKYNGPSMLATSLSVEVGELLEHFLWKTDDEIANKLKTDPDKKEAVADELADVLYHVLILADYFEIDIPDALKNKLDKNKKKYPVHKFKGQHGH